MPPGLRHQIVSIEFSAPRITNAVLTPALRKSRLGRIACPHQIALLRRQWQKLAEPTPRNEGEDARAEDRPASDAGEADDLAPARGIGVSVAVGIALWLAIIAVLLAIWGLRFLVWR